MSDQNILMPTALRDIHNALSTELNWICAKFKIYKQLFGPNQDRIKLINAKAKDFFVIVENSMADDILISLCRITDRLKSVGHECLVLERLAENLNDSTVEEAAFKESIRQESIEIRKYCYRFRQWRDNRIAHANLDVSLDRVLRPLPEVRLEMIEDGLIKISNLMNRVEGHFVSSETRYLDIVLRGDGDDLVFFLEMADKYEELDQRGVK